MTTPTLPPPVDQPGTAAPTFSPPTGAQILRALRAPAIGYAWLLLGAVMATVLIVIAAATGSTGDSTGVDSDDTNAFGVLIGMPFQIAGMALLGSLRFTEDGVQASLFFPPLSLTALYVVMTALAARRGVAIPAAGTRALLGLMVGFAMATVLTPLTWALAMRSDGVALSATSVGLFFGTWALTALASFAGSTRAIGHILPEWIPSDWRAAARVWVGSVTVWAALSLVVLTVVAAIRVDLWVGILAPLWGVHGGLYSYAIGHLGAVSIAGENFGIGDLDTLWTIVVIIAAVALAALTSIAWHLRRNTRGSALTQPGSWLALPATYVVGGMFVVLVPTVVMGGGLGEFGGSVTVQPAFWVMFVLLGWGAAVEALSRYVAPSLAPVLPQRLHTLLRGPESTRDTSVDEAGSVEAGSVEAPPLTAEERARYKRIGIITGALSAVAIIGWIAASVVNSQFYGPEEQVAAYLDAVVDGDLDQANALVHLDGDTADASLMTSAVYQAAGNTINGYEIGDSETSGNRVTFQVRLKGLDQPGTTELSIIKDGRTAVLFDRWRLDEGGLATPVTVSLPEAAGDLMVNDIAVDRVEGDVWMLPGNYLFDAFAGSRWLTSAGKPTTITADDDYQHVEVAGAVASRAFRDEVQTQVDAHVNECLASTDLEPANCPNSTFAFGDVRKVEWSLLYMPIPDFDSFDGTFPADLSYGESGVANVTFESDESYGFGPRDWQPQTDQSDLYLSSVTVDESGDSLVVTISE